MTATRRILRLTGRDTDSFLQGLVTNDVAQLDRGLVYAALLTPQGKYLADFFLKAEPDRILLDVPCSNTGVISRRVDVRWRLSPQEFAQV